MRLEWGGAGIAATAKSSAGRRISRMGLLAGSFAAANDIVFWGGTAPKGPRIVAPSANPGIRVKTRALSPVGSEGMMIIVLA